MPSSFGVVDQPRAIKRPDFLLDGACRALVPVIISPIPLFSLPRACHPPTLSQRSRVTLTRLDDANYRIFSDRYDFGKRSQQLTSDPSGTSPTFQPCHGRRCGGDPATCEAVMLRLALAEGRVCILLAETLLCCGRLQLGCQEPQPRDACPPGSTQ